MNLAIFDFDADGGDHGFEGTGGQTYALKLRANPPDGVRTVRWDVWDLDSYVEGASALQNPPRQAGTTTELVLDNGVTTGQRVSALTPSDEVDITLPSETGVAWIVRCVVNNATLVDAAGRTRLVPEWVYQRMVYIPDGNGLRPIVQGELREGSSGGWVEPFNAALALIGGGGGAVSSVYGRTGAVVAAASDYNASQVDNDSSVTGAFVDDALDQLDTDLGTLAGAALNAPADPADDNKVPVGASGNLAYSTATIGATVVDLVARDLLTTGKLIGSNGLIMSGESAISVDAGDLKVGSSGNTADMRLGVAAGQRFEFEIDDVATATLDATDLNLDALNLKTTTGFLGVGASLHSTIGDLRFDVTSATSLITWHAGSGNYAYIQCETNRKVTIGGVGGIVLANGASALSSFLVAGYLNAAGKHSFQSNGAWIGSQAISLCGGTIVVAVADATTEPTSDPASSGILWSYGGRFRARQVGVVTDLTAKRTVGSRQHYHSRAVGDLNTTTAATTELVRITLPDGYFGPVVLVMSGKTQASESSNVLTLRMVATVSTASGSAVILDSDGTPKLKGTASSTPWAVVPSVSGLDLIISVDGQASGTVEWSASLTAEDYRPGSVV